ncbi:AraC family transcriptional regulator [Paenibacillus qinlingensis]|uniref:AraC-like DNA-binding protein n=1 Tax=Paenibacillus qinlingensis TaxID=1837343 RepID=A0ABU1NTF4_9BACL|nr:AraC family transcriptional regulator [Paenibacillus qinlingensis]MDR6550739.1 AraC-like DNA-binding protein [Paenibacillus qinlingensis]
MTFRKLYLPHHGVHLYESQHRDRNVVGSHHHDVYQLLYGMEGEGQITLNGKTYQIGQDVAALIVPYSEHSISTTSKLTLLVLAFHRTSIDIYAQEELLGKFFGASSLLKLNAFASSELRRLLRKMLYEQLQEDLLNTFAIKLHMEELLLELARSQQIPHTPDANSLRAERICNYIDTHYFEPITSTDIAVRMNMSVRHVSSIFKERYQKTPSQYLSEVRIGVASKLLLETDKDIVSICFEVGYETVSAFYRTFRNMVGMSPNHFRQSVKRNN